jgi:hypothetical protein
VTVRVPGMNSPKQARRLRELSAECGRHRQAGVVHAVEQSPAAIEHSDDGAQEPGIGDNALDLAGVEVVVPQQGAGAADLGAPGEERAERGEGEEGLAAGPVELRG